MAIIFDVLLAILGLFWTLRGLLRLPHDLAQLAHANSYMVGGIMGTHMVTLLGIFFLIYAPRWAMKDYRKRQEKKKQLTVVPSPSV